MRHEHVQAFDNPVLEDQRRGEHEGASIVSTWPAAGGGLLVCTKLLIFEGTNRHPPMQHDNFFIHVPTAAGVRVMVPYVWLSAASRKSIADIVSGELKALASLVCVEDAAQLRHQNPATFPSAVHGEFDIDGGPGDSIRATAIVARSMLIGAAAELWDVCLDECIPRNGSIIHRRSGQGVTYQDLAAVASLQHYPDLVMSGIDRRFTVQHGWHRAS